MNSSQPVALITGSASGLGRALCIELAREGWTIVGADVDLNGARETTDLALQHTTHAEHHHLDVTQPEAWEQLAAHIDEAFGRCDLLINNAGVATAGRVGESSLDDWRWCIDIDLLGPIYGCHTFVPRMRTAGRGTIINISSIAAYSQATHMGAYNAAKAGLVALSETLRAELLDTDIHVSVVCPAFFKTNIDKNMRSSSALQNSVSRLLDRSNLSAEHVAQQILAETRKHNPIIVLPKQAHAIYALRRLFPARATEIFAKLWAPKKKR